MNPFRPNRIYAAHTPYAPVHLAWEWVCTATPGAPLTPAGVIVCSGGAAGTRDQMVEAYVAHAKARHGVDL